MGRSAQRRVLVVAVLLAGACQSSGARGGGEGAGGGQTGGATGGNAFSVDANGVTLTLGTGKERIAVCQSDIIHVSYTTASALPAKTELAVSNPWSAPVPFCASETSGTVTITTSRMKVKINESSGLVTYADLGDAALLSEGSKGLTAATVEGVGTHTVKATFNSPTTTRSTPWRGRSATSTTTIG